MHQARSYIFGASSKIEQEDNALKQQTCDVETAVKIPEIHDNNIY